MSVDRLLDAYVTDSSSDREKFVLLSNIAYCPSNNHLMKESQQLVL